MRPSRCFLALVALTAVAASASIPATPLHRLSGTAGLKLRLTADMRDVTVEQAAARLSTHLGGRIRVFEHLTGYSDDYTLDRTRRATLVWNDVPVGKAVREFSRAYECSLRPYGDGTYGLWPSGKPLGPAVRNDGHEFEVTQASYNQVCAGLDLRVRVSSGSGDAAAVSRLESLRIRDGNGELVHLPAIEGDFTSLDAPGSYPDERVVGISSTVRRPPGDRLTLVEGSVRTFRKVRRFNVEVPFPQAGHP